MEKKTSKHCGRQFPGMNEFSGVTINVDEVRDAVKKFERQLKSGRVFFPGDAPFAMKCETLLKNAASDIEGLSASGRSFTATDKTLYAEGDAPKTVTVDESDIIAVLDNTKKGLFGGLEKKECALGALVTTKGVLSYNEGGSESGFVTWPSIAVSTDRGYSSVLFCGKTHIAFPCGPRLWLSLSNGPDRGRDSSFHELVLHLCFIARGNGSEFDYDEFRPEGAGDADE